MNEPRGRILIVDDEPIIRGMLKTELEESFEVEAAGNAAEALERCRNNAYDLVISDINMPGTKGYDLLAEVKRTWPKTRVALITAYNVDDYVRMAKDHGISNIIPKTTPFNFDELNTLVRGLVTEDIFGIERQMKKPFEIVRQYTVTQSDDIPVVENDIMGQVTRFFREERFLRVLLEEAISNAVYHAPVNERGETKYKKHSRVVLAQDEYVDIFLARDEEKYGVSVIDKSGALSKETVLYKIDRNIHGDGVLDENGRGIHMSRLYSDRLIINLKPGVKTEVIFLNYYEDKYLGYKPLYINEL